MAHQRLRHRCIHRVHGHVVPVIGSPSQCQFRQIPGSDNHTIPLVGKIHQDLRPLSGLPVLIGDIMHGRILSDIREMHVHRVLDIYFHKLCPQTPNQLHRIVISPIRGAKARHRHRHNTASVSLQQVKSFDCHKKSQRRIQPTGNSDNHCLTAGVFQPLFQPKCLYHQNLVATRISLRRIARHKRRPIHIARQLRLCHTKRKQNPHMGIFCHKGRHSPTVCFNALHIKLCLAYSVGKTLFCQQMPVFRNNVMTGIHHILRGLAISGGGIDVAAYQTCGLSVYQFSPIMRFTGNLIRCRQIHNNIGTRQRMTDTWRIRRPQVLAEFHANGQLRHLLTYKNQIRRNGNDISIRQSNLCVQLRPRRKMPHFIKLIVVGKPCLGNHTKHFSTGNGRSHIVQLSVHNIGKSHKINRIIGTAARRQLHQFLRRAL